MASQIDITKPVFGTPTTQSVRDNFTTAANEITTLQGQASGSPFLPLAGGRMTGVMYLYNDPTDAMMPATKGYVDSGAGSGGGGLPEAPTDGQYYGRESGSWQPVLPLAGGTLLGALVLHADPTAALGAVTKQYADAIGAAHLTDAPNDANTYGRHANAWAGVLPIVGGQVTGSLGIGRVLPASLQVGSMLAVVATASTFLVNAYTDSTGQNRYRAAGPAIAFGQYGNNGGLYVAPTGVADAAATFLSPPIQFDTKGSLIMPGAPVIPTDNVSPWISSNEFVTQGHYAFNSYIAAPGTWKYLAAGYAAQWWQDSAGNGIVSLNISQSSGAAGGVQSPATGFQFYPNGNFTMGGVFQAGHAVMATASAGNAYVGSYQTAGTGGPVNCGFWTYNNLLYFGNADGNGVPSASRTYIDANGNIFAGAGVFVGNSSNTGFFVGGGATTIQFSNGWFLQWNTTTGNLAYGTPGGAQINTRQTPDTLVWNQIGPLGGVGAYVVLSDERAKGDVAVATVGLPEILQLVPINFTRVGQQAPEGSTLPDGVAPIPPNVHPPEIGFSAQQVQPIIPEAVRVVGWTLPDGSGGFDTDDPSLGLVESAILAAAVNAIKNIDERLRAKGI